MSTRYDKEINANELPGGYEGNNVTEDFEIPPCSIEDVDRALFDLFNEQIPLYFRLRKKTNRVPVIFATGERFAILRRKRPLRDKAGSLILPLVSVLRTGIEQQPSLGASGGQTAPMVIKKKLSKNDKRYQALINKLGINNQDNVTSSKNVKGRNDAGKRAVAEPGTSASRNGKNVPSVELSDGKVLSTDLGKNIFEVIQMPPVKYFQATYEITYWAQYMKQMNDMLTATMVTPHNYHGRTFRIESKKGYWFSAFVDTALNSGVNFEDFSDDERVIKYSFTVNVVGYIIAPEFPGAKIPLKSFISAPTFSFDVSQVNDLTDVLPGSVPSGDPNDYILSDLSTDLSTTPTQAIASDPVANSLSILGITKPGASTPTGASAEVINVGGFERIPDVGGTSLILRKFIDPFTGKVRRETLRVSQANTKKGETVFRSIDSKGQRSGETFVLDLGTLVET